MGKTTGGTQDVDTKDAAIKRVGFDDKGVAYPGVDPETGERKAVTFEGLKKEFGAKDGERIYFEISRIGGHGVEPSAPIDFRPDLSLNMPKDKRAEVEKVLASVNLSPMDKVIAEG